MPLHYSMHSEDSVRDADENNSLDSAGSGGSNDFTQLPVPVVYSIHSLVLKIPTYLMTMTAQILQT